jgi:hypothetical protein
MQKANVEMLAVDLRKLPKLLGGSLPMDPRLFPSNHATFKTWRLGLVSMRPDGHQGSLVACFSKKNLDLNNAALGVSQNDLGPTVFVCRTDQADRIEAMLPPNSRVVDFDEFWSLGNDGFRPGNAAKRILSGWENDTLEVKGGVQSRTGYIFEQRGKKKTRINNESYDLTTWRCWFDGRNFDLPDVVGSELLVRILLQRGEFIYADALLRSLSGEATDVADENDLEWLGTDEFQSGTKRFAPNARDEILTSEEITLWQNRARAIERAIVECGDDPGLVGEKNSLIDTREEVVKYLMAATKPGPDGTLLPKTFDGALEKAGNLVGKHIRGVINRLKDIDEGLWSHLSNKSILKPGQVCQYDAEFGYKWRKKNSENLK